MWTLEEARAFLTATESDRYHALWSFLIGTGCRIGEALGLTWEDVGSDGIIYVKRTCAFIGQRSIIQAPKTASSARLVTVPSFVTKALDGWREKQVTEREQAGALWKDQRNAVFLTSRGTTPTPTQLRYAFLRGCQKAGVKPCRIHDLRHLAATLLIANGVDPKTVQKRLGHSSVTITLAIYAKAVTEKDRDASSVMEKALVG